MAYLVIDISLAEAMIGEMNFCSLQVHLRFRWRELQLRQMKIFSN